MDTLIGFVITDTTCHDLYALPHGLLLPFLLFTIGCPTSLSRPIDGGVVVRLALLRVTNSVCRRDLQSLLSSLPIDGDRQSLLA